MFSAIRRKMGWLFVVVAAAAFAYPLSAQMVVGTDSGLGGANMITGTVLGPSGQRIETAVNVRLRTMTRGDRVATTDTNGNFAFKGLVNGDYQIVIEKEAEYETYSTLVNIFQMRNAPPVNYPLNIRLKYKPGVTPKPGVVNSELAG